jgi:hypothetical protein
MSPAFWAISALAEDEAQEGNIAKIPHIAGRGLQE